MAMVTLEMGVEEALETVLQVRSLVDGHCSLGEDELMYVGARGLEGARMLLDVSAAVLSAELFGGAYDDTIPRYVRAVKSEGWLRRPGATQLGAGGGV